MPMADQPGPGTPKLEVSTRLAFERTLAAYERTMLAWVRTATSLITFGFTIYKFFQLEGHEGARTNPVIGSRGFALMLVGIGLTSLLLATLEYRRNIRMLRTEYSGGGAHSLSVVVAFLVSMLGILALLAMLFRQ